MAIKLVVKEIEKLSQDEGLTDQEIADKLGCSRATVNRTRIKYNIPTANFENRADKEYTCLTCGKKVYIKRCEVMKLQCPECEKKTKNKNNQEE